ncbi:MAG: hypothetical protein H7301_03720 [Cryobacterium sp.]|nr:hypothetical protein [Oligoflexia bacterium]
MRNTFVSLSLFLCVSPCQAAESALLSPNQKSCSELLKQDEVFRAHDFFRKGAESQTEVSGHGWTQHLYFGRVGLGGPHPEFLKTSLVPFFRSVNEALSPAFRIPESTEVVLAANQPSRYQDECGRIQLGISPGLVASDESSVGWSEDTVAVLTHEYAHQIFEENAVGRKEKIDSAELRAELSNIDLYRRYENIENLKLYLESRKVTPEFQLSFMLMETKIRSDLEKVSFDHYTSFLQYLWMPLNELFADAVVVALAHDSAAQSRAIERISGGSARSRDFGPKVLAADWRTAEIFPHDVYTPVRSYLWNSVLRKNLTSDASVILKQVYEAIWEELGFLTKEVGHLDGPSILGYFGKTGRLKQMNARLIQRIARRLPNASRRRIGK